MKFSIQTSVIAEAVATVSNVVSKKDILPILKSFLFQVPNSSKEPIRIMGTDQVLGLVEYVLPYNLEKGGSVAISAEKIQDIVSMSNPDDDVFLELSGENKIKIKTSDAGYVLVCYEDVTGFPVVAVFPDDGAIEFDRSNFLYSLRMVAYCVPSDETKRSLMAVKVLSDSMMASDGRRAFKAKKHLTDSDVVLYIPSPGIMFLERLLETSVSDTFQYYSGDDVWEMFKIDNKVYTIRKYNVEFKYPDIDELFFNRLENLPHRLEVVKGDFERAIMRAKVASDEVQCAVRMKITKKGADATIVLEALDTIGNVSRTVVDGKWSTSDYDVSFNWNFLLQALRAIGGPADSKIVIHFPKKDGGFRAMKIEGDDYLCGIMLVRDSW